VSLPGPWQSCHLCSDGTTWQANCSKVTAYFCLPGPIITLSPFLWSPAVPYSQRPVPGPVLKSPDSSTMASSKHASILVPTFHQFASIFSRRPPSSLDWCSLSQAAAFMAFTFQGRSSVSWRWWIFRVIKHHQHNRNYWKNLRTHPQDDHWKIHELADTVEISYGVCQAILTENLNMHHTATKSVSRLLTNDQKQWCVNVCFELREKPNEDPTLIPILLFFPKLKMNWRDNVLKQCLTYKGNHKWYSTALRKMAFIVLFKHGKNNWIAVYIHKETILKEVANKMNKLSKHFFYPIQEFPDSSSCFESATHTHAHARTHTHTQTRARAHCVGF
jgi:hypothetical protein